MKHLLIVQDRPTQFDVPLYNKIAVAGAPFLLSVLYTQTGVAGAGYDPEIGRSPAWDHVGSEAYQRFDLGPGEASDLDVVLALVRRLRPDHVLISGYYPPLHRKLVRPLQYLGCTVGLRSDNTLLHSDFRGLRGLGKSLLLPFWLARYDCWHPVGSGAQQYLEQVSGVRRPCFPFPYSVDNDWFLAQSDARRGRRSELLAAAGFADDSFVVLGIMKWHRREDPLTLVHAFLALLERLPQARLILVGDGPLRPQVEALLAPVQRAVHLPGYVAYSALPGFYAMADVFVHPAPGEPWGVSVNEALACGVPVMAAHGVGAADDLVQEGVNGGRFANGDATALAVQLARLGAQDDRAALRLACLHSVQPWSYQHSITAFAQALEWA